MDLMVLYGCLHGAATGLDTKFGLEFQWDIPLLNGYRWKCLPSVTGSRYPRAPLRPLSLAVIRELVGGRYDVLVVHGYAEVTDWLAIGAARAGGTAVLVRGESNLLRSRRPWKRAAKRLVMKLLFSMIDGYIAIGSESRRYAEFYGMPPNRIFVAPYCVDNRLFKLASTGGRQRIRAEMGIAADAVVFAYVGKLYSRKAPMDLLEAFALSGACGSAVLMFVGDGVQRCKLEERAKSERLEGVRFAGFVNQSGLPQYYAASDAVVLPSLAEPWGLVINEAMACGRAVVASSACGSAADLVREGVNGYVFPAGDVRALAEILRHLRTNPKKLQAMGRASEAIIADWSPEVCAGRIAEAARRVVECRRSAAWLPQKLSGG